MTCSPDVRLRPFVPEDSAATFGWVLRPELREAFLMRGVPTPETHRAYFSRALADGSQRLFAITEGGVHVGNCGLRDVDPAAARATLWIYIGDPAMRGRGIGGLAAGLLVEEALGPMGLTALDLCVASDNTPAVRMYRRLGFTPRSMTEDEMSAWGDRAASMTAMTLRRSRP